MEVSSLLRFAIMPKSSTPHGMQALQKSDATLRLRRHFAQHNRRVFLLACMTALTTLAAWAALYFLAYWLVLLVVTVDRTVEARMPASFPFVFAGVALTLCALAWVIRRLSPDEFPRDKKSIPEILLDFILTVPRMTLAIWGTLRALQFLDERELALAMQLLQRIERENTLPIYSAPLEIADERMRAKILLALQITEIIEARKTKDGIVLALRGEEARALCQRLVRLRGRGRA